MDQHYLFIANTDAGSDQSGPGEFTVTLPQTLQLPHLWECSLKHLSLKDGDLPSHVTSFFVCCDFCEESIVKSKGFSVLRQVSNFEKDFTFLDPYYMRVTRTAINSFKISIRDQELEPVWFSGTVTCTLHFRRA